MACFIIARTGNQVIANGEFRAFATPANNGIRRVDFEAGWNTVVVVINVGKVIGAIAIAVDKRPRDAPFAVNGRSKFSAVVYAVTIAVRRFAWVVGEGVLTVEHTVVVRIDVDDGDLVAHHGLTGIRAVGGCDFSLPGLAGRGQRGSDGGFSIVCGVDGAVDVPLNGGSRLGVAVVVVVLVGEGQRLVGRCFR